MLVHEETWTGQKEVVVEVDAAVDTAVTVEGSKMGVVDSSKMVVVDSSKIVVDADAGVDIRRILLLVRRFHLERTHKLVKYKRGL